jgi:hypothetical protein
MNKDKAYENLMKTMAANAAENGIPWPPIENLGDQAHTAETPNKESKGASSTPKKQVGGIPATVNIDIGPKYRIQIDENNPSSIEAVKKLINSEPVISPTTMATVATEIIGILTKNNIVPTIHINLGPHVDIIRKKPAENTDTKTDKGDKSK